MEENKTMLLVIDKDECPKQDNVIYRGQCQSCEHYLSFKMWEGFPCIECGYWK